MRGRAGVGEADGAGAAGDRALRWRPLADAEAAAWTPRLVAAGASLFQLPYWNEPLRALGLRPRHLALDDGGAERGYACVLTLGVPGLRLGLVQRGPVMLDGGRATPAAMAALAAWARRAGYVFLRFTHDDAAPLALAAALPGARAEDGFPPYREPDEALVVPQDGSDAEVLARLQPVARRDIARAAAAGYAVTRDDAPEALAAVWPLFEGLGRRKAFSFRPLASFQALLRHARPHEAAAVYVASLGGRPVQAILVVRAGDTAHYISGALDVAALGGAHTPSTYLHWQAMRDFARAGARRYDLGTRSGAVYQFKRKFRPEEHRCPPPVTVVLNRPVYALWRLATRALTGSRLRRLKALLVRPRAGAPPAAAPAAPAGAPAGAASAGAASAGTVPAPGTAVAS